MPVRALRRNKEIKGDFMLGELKTTNARQGIETIFTPAFTLSLFTVKNNKCPSGH